MRILKVFSFFIITLFSITACQKATELEINSAEVQSVVNQPEQTRSAEALNQRVMHPEHFQTVKPSAAVSFTSDFSGSLAVGEATPITIQLSSEYAQGSMSVEIIGTGGLIVQGQTSFTQPFVQGEQVFHEFLISAEAPGEYRLGIIANVVTASGLNESKAFSEVIYVGAEINSATLEEVKAGLVEQSSIQSQQIDSEPSYLQAIEEVYIAP